mgnify:CR=1 FL=1
MIHILTILESAVANIISHYICKWLDRLVSPTKWKAPWERQLLGGFSFLVKPMESSHNPIFSICDSPQKSSAVQKVYRAALSVSG